MLINIRTSETNKQVVQELTRRLNLGAENVISRIAFSYSLSKGMKLDLEDIQDSKGKEYKEDILFGKYKDYYVALVCQHYGLYKTDKDVAKYIKMHIDNGLELINKLFESNRNYTGLDFLIENIERGIDSFDASEISLDPVKNNNQKISKDYFSGAIKLKVGKHLEGKDAITLNINDTQLHNNAHIAVAGNSGTGKTQFALSLLSQFSKASKGKVKFIFMDYKGVKDSDRKSLQPFFDATNCTLIDAPQKPFPLNPLTFIDNINEKNKILGINKFVDIIAKYSNLGKNQEQTLKEATKEVFNKKKHGQYPNLQEIYDKVIELAGDKASTLKEILERLSEVELFESKSDVNKSFLNENYYLSLSGDLADSVRFTATFLVINYIYNTFMNMENAPIEDNLQGIRYVLLIDEAHNLFKDKKSQDLLEKILREIRSKGVSVILLSQGVDEFNQPTFDFSSMCETAFLFDIKDKTNLKSLCKFLGVGDKESTTLARNMEKIQKGQAVTNMKEVKKAELIEISQFYKS